MYLSEIKITNFRKFGMGENGEPGITLVLKNGLNILIGENDSGKTCIIDAVRLVLSTQSKEYFRLDKDDFHEDSNDMKIECIFKDFDNNSAKDFLEWLGIDDEKEFFLKVMFNAKKYESGKIFIDDIRAGMDEEGQILNSKARDLLRTIYLKPLRNAENELTARRNSRLSQILFAHPEFKSGDSHELAEIMKKANDEIKEYFNYRGEDEEIKVLKILNNFLEAFSDNNNLLKSEINITDSKLKAILEKLDLVLNEIKPGLGSYNQLYIATELLLLKNDITKGLKLALIEEIESHLHPQAQLRVIEYLQSICEGEDCNMQILLTTHSVTLASSIKLDNLIIFTENNAFPLRKGQTELKNGDYNFLERFLDSTKANLFFAKGVMIVEGDAENILIPAMANLIGKKLSKYGVSIVNVGGKALLRYAKIFMRKNQKKMQMPIAVITDCDEAVYCIKDKEIVEKIQDPKVNIEKIKEKHNKAREKYEKDNVKVFVSPQWTLEFDIACSCLNIELFAAIKMANDYKKSDNNEEYEIKEISIYIDEAIEEIESWKDMNIFEIAKNITEKVVIKKAISKAVVAQCFAKILEDKDFDEDEKKEIYDDTYLKYITDAIYYVTGGQ